jgi:hypothetical protein
MESLRRNLSENIFSKTGIFQNGIVQKESFRKGYFSQHESFRMESFRMNFSENIFNKTGIFQNGIFQKESFRKYFEQNRNLSEWNLSERIFQKGIFQKESFRKNLSEGIFQK